MSVSLVLDVRERGLATALTTLGIPYTTASLDVGDFLIQAADGQPLVVVERKSLADFAASNQDGRYREQRARLMAVRGGGVAVAYVLEGRWSGYDDRPVGGTRTTEGQLRRLTTRLVLRYGMPVIASDSIADTATWCRVFLAQLSDDVTVFQPEDGMAAATAAAMTHMTAALSTTKKANRTPASVATTMLSAIPGLGEKRVTALLAEKSVADLTMMTAASIGDLIIGGKRLGPALGELIASALAYKAT
jgi:ERCC4-type nuclease